MSWLDEEIMGLEYERKKKEQDPMMITKILFMVIILGSLLYCSNSYGIESPEARKIPISGDLWKCSSCGSLQVNKKPACEFCGNRIDRD